MSGQMEPPRSKRPAKSRLLAWSDRTWAEFVGGLTEFSWLAVWTAALLVLATFAVSAWFFRYETLAGPAGVYLARSTRDVESHVTVRAMNIPRLSQERPQLIVLGSSITATALADQTALDRAVDQATGRDWDVSILCTPLQTAFDQLTLLEAALKTQPKAEVLVLIGTNAMRNGYPDELTLHRETLGRLGLRSDWADEAVRQAGRTPRPRSDWYVIENSRFVAVTAPSALLRLLARRPAAYDPGILAPRTSLPDSRRRRPRMVELVTAAHDARGSLSQDLLGTIRQRLAAYPTVRLAYLEEMVNPEALVSLGLVEKEKAITDRFRVWAKAQGVPFWELSDEVSPPPAVYFDDLHINSKPVQQAFREALARRVAAFDGASDGQ